jgi:hypothetical protein
MLTTSSMLMMLAFSSSSITRFTHAQTAGFHAWARACGGARGLGLKADTIRQKLMFSGDGGFMNKET